MFRPWLVGASVAIGSWVILLLVLGNVGLQQAVSRGPLSTDRAVGFLLIVLWSGLVGLAAATPTRPAVGAGIAAMLLLDVAAALVGVLLVGELGPDDLARVFVVVSALGLQPLGFVVGALLKARRPFRRRSAG